LKAERPRPWAELRTVREIGDRRSLPVGYIRGIDRYRLLPVIGKFQAGVQAERLTAAVTMIYVRAHDIALGEIDAVSGKIEGGIIARR
jgi:hypothetical protein